MDLKQLRRSKGLSRKELGEKIGLSEHAVRSYEQGTRSPNVEALFRMANALGVDINEAYRAIMVKRKG